MLRPRVVVAGRVVDASARPVSGATLELYRASAPGDQILYLGSGGGLGEIRAIEGLKCRSGSDGAFELRTSEPLRVGEQRMFLRASAEGYGDLRALTFDEGETDLVVALDKPGELIVDTGSIPAEIQEQLDLRLYDEFAARLDDRELAPVVRFAPLRHGAYSLSLTLGGCEFMTLEGIVVPPGAASSDPRIAPLWFSQEIAARGFQLALPEDANVTEATVYYWMDGDDDDDVVWTKSTLRSGVAAVVVAPKIVRTALRVDGFASVEVTELPGGARVEPVPEMHVELAFTGDPDFLDGSRVGVNLVGNDLPGPDLLRFRELSPQRTRTFRLPGPGHYSAELETEDESMRWHSFEVQPGATRVEIDLRRKRD